MYKQVVLYVFLRPSFCCQLKQMSMLLLYTVIQYVIALLYVIIKQVDNFKDKVHAKKNSFLAHRKHGTSTNNDQLLDAVWEK